MPGAVQHPNVESDERRIRGVIINERYYRIEQLNEMLARGEIIIADRFAWELPEL